MSILGGAIGAGFVLAAIAHEMSLAREAERINEEIDAGEVRADIEERSARERNLREMRGITEATMRNRMMREGIMPTVSGRGAGAVYTQELARRGGRY